VRAPTPRATGWWSAGGGARVVGARPEGVRWTSAAGAPVRRGPHPLPPPRVAAAIEPAEDGTARVAFEAPVAALAPGQAAVFYDGERVLGGGWIAGALP
jgi:hypothetical protein